MLDGTESFHNNGRYIDNTITLLYSMQQSIGKKHVNCAVCAVGVNVRGKNGIVRNAVAYFPLSKYGRKQ